MCWFGPLFNGWGMVDNKCKYGKPQTGPCTIKRPTGFAVWNWAHSRGVWKHSQNAAAEADGHCKWSVSSEQVSTSTRKTHHVGGYEFQSTKPTVQKWHIPSFSINQFNCSCEPTFFHTWRKPQPFLGSSWKSKSMHGSAPLPGIPLRSALHFCMVLQQTSAASVTTWGRDTEEAVYESSLPKHSRQPFLLGDIL